MTDAIAEGDTAPAFTAPRDGGDTVSLADFAGRSVILYFYPRDDTPGCTTEALEFTALAEEFAAANAVVVGVSKDSVRKHDRFRDKHALGVILVSDDATSIAEDYGVWTEKKMYGKVFMGIERTTFLIDPTGTVGHVWRRVKPGGHAAEVLDAIGKTA